MMPASAQPEQTHIAQELAHDRPLVSCAFDLSGKYVFAGAEDRNILRWTLDGGQKTVLSGHDSWVFALGGTPDGQTLLSGGGDGTLKWWPMADESPTPSRSVDAHAGWIRSLAVSPDGQTVATGGNDRMVRLWSVADGSLIRELPGHDRIVYKVAFRPDGKTLLSADLKGVVIEWDHGPGKEARRFDASKLHKYETGQGVDYGGVRDFDLSADGAYFACAGQVESSNPLGAVSNPALVLFNWAEAKELLLQRPKADLKGVAWGIRFHPDGFQVMVSGGTGGGHLLFFRPDAVNEFHTVNLTNTGRAMALNPDGLRIATAHHDGKVRICLMAPKPA